MDRAKNNLPLVVHPSRSPIYTFFLANSISYIGNRLTLLAIPWYVLQTTGSVAQTGLTAFASTLPFIISAFFGSVFVDALGFKRTSVLSDCVSGLCIGTIPLCANTIGLPFWFLLILVFLGGLLKSPGQTARSSLLPDLVQTAQILPERANAIAEGVSRSSIFIGTPLAAFLIIWIGTGNLLWLDALSFLISALLIGVFVQTTQKESPPDMNKKESYQHRLHAGIQFILHDTVLVSIIASSLLTNLLDQALSSVVAPAYMQQVFHSPLPFGWIFGVLGGTAFIGTLIFGAIGHRLPRRLTYGIGFTIGGAARFWILLVPILPLLIGVYAIAGLGLAPLNPIVDTILQERVSASMRARVFGAVTAGVYIGIPVGSLLGGLLVTWIGIQNSLLLMGGLYFITTISLLINPALKKLDETQLTTARKSLTA